MTQFIIANIGSYPRIGEEKDQQRHRRGFTNFENKEISAHAFRDVEHSVIQEAIREQIICGLDEVTDGLVAWQDPFSHFCKKNPGIRINGLLRVFDTNFYYRVPVITASKLRPSGPLIAPEFELAQGISSKPVRSVLTGPYTLAAHTRSSAKAYAKMPARLDFFSTLIAEEIKALVAKGAKLIQIDEPSLAQNPADAPLVRKAFEKLVQAAAPLKITLALYFAPVSELYERLKSWPLAGVNLDFTYDGKRLLEKLLESAPPFEIGFGFLNARSTRLEAIDPILNAVRSFAEKFQPELCRITPSAGLEYLPRDTAVAKLNLLAKIKEELGSSAGNPAAHA